MKNLYKKNFMNKRNILIFLCDPSNFLKIFLILIFSIIYLPHAFVLVNDLGLIIGYEVDPGSIIAAIESILRSYNMHGAYHSKYYGWTYFSINYIILIPIKIFCSFFEIESKVYLYTAIRLILFLIGLISLIAFYEILKKIFSSKILPFTGALFYILSDVGYKFFYFLHPETTGIMFIFFALLYLLKFIDNPQNYKFYFYGLIFLVLASLSKQIFFFVSLPLLILFFHFYCIKERKKYINFLFSKKFSKTLGYTIVISISILFIIHPYCIFDFHNFLKYQMELTGFVSGDYVVSLDKLFGAWKYQFFSVPIIKLVFYLLPVSFIVSIIYYSKFKSDKATLYIVNSVSIILLSSLIIFGNRYFINISYAQPFYPFFIINLLSMIAFTKNINFKKIRVVKFVIIVLFVCFITFSLSRSVYYNIPKIFDRLSYEDSIAYVTYNYIKNNITSKDKVVYDHHVAFPSTMENYGCHFWHGCGTDYIDEYEPNYIIFYEDYKINGKKHAETERLKQYIKEKQIALVKELHGKDITISVYKKL